jgi:hypothetical protein
MQNPPRRIGRFIALLVLLPLLAALVAKRQALTVHEAEDDAARAVGKVNETIVRDEKVAVAVLVVAVLFGFVIWTAIRANQVEDKAMPPGRGSSASHMRTDRERSTG